MFNSKEKKELEQLSNSSNHLGKGTIIKGDLESYGNIRIEGNVNGNVTTKSKIVLGDSGVIKGNLLAQNAEVSGEIVGNVEVSDLLILKSTSIINGDIFTNKLVVESGAQFNGSCKMGAVVKEITLGESKEQHRKEKSA